jgi:hypothetical protein
MQQYMSSTRAVQEVQQAVRHLVQVGQAHDA